MLGIVLGLVDGPKEASLGPGGLKLVESTS